MNMPLTSPSNRRYNTLRFIRATYGQRADVPCMSIVTIRDRQLYGEKKNLYPVTGLR